MGKDHLKVGGLGGSLAQRSNSLAALKASLSYRNGIRSYSGCPIVQIDTTFPAF